MSVRRRSAALLATLPALLLALTGCGDGADSAAEPERAPASAQERNPFTDRAPYADPGSKAAQAASEAAGSGRSERAEVLSRLAEVPQGIWLTPEEHPVGAVGGFVAKVVAAADAVDQVPTFVVYGVPDRDCSGRHSAGGLAPEQYGPWVGEIAEAAADGERVAAVVEPDALATLLECGDVQQRTALIADAVQRLTEAGVTTYLDGGHSHWTDPGELAPLLQQAGVARARGFATNVSNFQTDEDEQRYAERLSSLLGGAHYVVDTGRNGFGATGEWCNPPGRAFGTLPGPGADGALDAYLWIKPPGESDGECHGGPAAGQFWPERAEELARASGW